MYLYLGVQMRVVAKNYGQTNTHGTSTVYDNINIRTKKNIKKMNKQIGMMLPKKENTSGVGIIMRISIAAFTLAKCGPVTIRPGTTGTARTRVQCLHACKPENKLQPVITAQRYVHAHFLATCAW